MKILFEYNRYSEHPTITIDGMSYSVINKQSGSITGLRDMADGFSSVDRYVEYEVEPIDERYGFPGLSVIASVSGFVIDSFVCFQMFMFTSGFQRNNVDKCSVNPCSIAMFCNLSASTLRSRRPTILIV